MTSRFFTVKTRFMVESTRMLSHINMFFRPWRSEHTKRISRKITWGECMAQAKKDYTALADEVDSLREQKQAIWVEKAQNEGLKKRIKEMEVFLSSQSKELTEYDETMVRLYIESIRIYDDRFEVTFKAGITVDVQR